MLYHNRLFLAVGLVLVGVLSYPSVAAPTVKRLGVSNNNNIQSNIKNIKTAAAKPSAASKISTTNVQRAPSVRVLGTSATKPTVKTISATKSTNTKAAANAANTERLSVIRNHLIKGGTGTTSNLAPQPQSVETDNMLKRIVALEEQMANLPEKVEEINQKIDEKADVANLSANYYTIGDTQDYLQQNYYTKQYVDQIVSQLSGANIVNTFDPGFLHQGESDQP